MKSSRSQRARTLDGVAADMRAGKGGAPKLSGSQPAAMATPAIAGCDSRYSKQRGSRRERRAKQSSSPAARHAPGLAPHPTAESSREMVPKKR